MSPEKNKDLSAINTLRVPSKASYFVQAKTATEVAEALVWAQQRGLAIYVLGGGSNVLLPSFIDGLVIQPRLTGVDFVKEPDGACLVKAGAGESWHDFVESCVGRGYCGIENLALIPGTVGAAPIQNIGAYGVELKDVFCELEAMEIATQKVRRFCHGDCEFQYRESIFKGRYHQQYIVLNVTLRLQSKMQPKIGYPALERVIDSEAPTAREVMAKVVEIRQAKLPDPAQVPNAGSFFKNPIVSAQDFDRLRSRYSELPCFDVGGDDKKLPAAWLIEQAGWKGKTQHGVKVHDSHALVLTNPAGCDLGAILRMAANIQEDVFTLFGVELEMEPQRLGVAAVN